ncbi:MFS transporter [Zunongwangia sp.]|uniref:MFS transporter n=1 Tax=Zunongwangia sp. TaxID=1965325 RepID=UPI003AA91B02
MKEFYRFIKINFRKISFGWLLTFLSSFGQTFLISLYVPHLTASFAITKGSFGALYAGATVIASVVMLTVGHTVDHKPIKKVTAFTILGLATACILLGASTNVLLLGLALIILRLCGQGLLSHISMTVISKLFIQNRGKALSFSSLGYSAGEALLPLVVSTIIAFFNWRVAAIGSGVILLLYLIRLKFTDLSHFDAYLQPNQSHSSKELIVDFKSVIFDRKFSILMPAIFSISFINTAIFFYQYVFVEEKGWSPTLYASFFTAYAATRFLFSLVSGVWIDKFTAKKLFRFYLIPLCLGLLCYAFIDSIVGALLYLILAGISTGFSGTVKTSIIAEVYGTEKMGAIRSVFTMFMVISTALGPLIVGTLIDANFQLSTIILVLFATLILVNLNSQRIARI